MIMVSFRTKRDKERLLEKARKMEEYASMIVECLEGSDYTDEYDERSYRGHEDDEEMMNNRYGYRKYRRM